MKKRNQRKWVRYEREHSMSLWQGDWKMVTLNGQDRWLIAFRDDSSRLIICYGVFDRPTTQYTIQVLEQGFLDYGVPREILTDHGSQFVSAREPETANHTFRIFMEYHGIRHRRARVHHPQTNGKIERFFGEVERRAMKSGSVEAVVHWKNEIKPHRSLEYDLLILTLNPRQTRHSDNKTCISLTNLTQLSNSILAILDIFGARSTSRSQMANLG